MSSIRVFLEILKEMPVTPNLWIKVVRVNYDFMLLLWAYLVEYWSWRFETSIIFVCCIHTLSISEIGRSLVQWRGRILVQYESQVQRGTDDEFQVHRETMFREELVTSELISNISLISKKIGTTCVGVEKMNTLHAYPHLWLIIIMDDLCDWWLILIALSLLFYAPLTYMNVFSPHVCLSVFFFTPVVHILR